MGRTAGCYDIVWPREHGTPCRALAIPWLTFECNNTSFFATKALARFVFILFYSKKKRKSYNHLPVYWLFMRRPVVFLNVIFSATKSVASGHNLPYIDCTFLICLNNCGLYIESSGSSYKQRDNPQSNLFVSLICWRVIRSCPFKVEQDLNTLNASFASTRWCQPTFFKFFSFFLFFFLVSARHSWHTLPDRGKSLRECNKSRGSNVTRHVMWEKTWLKLFLLHSWPCLFGWGSTGRRRKKKKGTGVVG